MSDKIDEILIGVELYGKCITGNWGRDPKAAKAAIFAVVMEALPAKQIKSIEDTEYDYQQKTGYNACLSQVQEALRELFR